MPSRTIRLQPECDMTTIAVKSKVLEANDAIASRMRSRFRGNHVFCMNFIGSPGSGKTRLLEATLPKLKLKYPCGVVEGDVKTDNDMRRIAALGIPAVQIETQGSCHLTAEKVEKSLDNLDGGYKLLIVENVGNLICTVPYDLGEDCRVTVVSVTEGEDKPLKYPAAFIAADIVVITKTDLEPYVDVSVEKLAANALSCKHDLLVFKTSAKTGEGIDALADYIAGELSRK